MNNSANAIWEQYQKGLKYFDRVGLTNEWREAEDFYEGRHWPAPTKRTKNLPRPVINLCAMIADNKKASILSGKLKMIFRPAELFGEQLEQANIGANLFTKFSENINKEMKLEDLDDQAQDYSTQFGSYVYHFFWDKEIVGGMETPYLGGMRAEVLHPKNVIVANPSEQDEQKQRYIIIAYVESLDSVKALAKANKVQNLDEIVADTEIDNEATKDDEVCTVLIKYFRINGKVYWCKSTKNIVIQKPTAWEPDVKKVKLPEEDLEEVAEPDEATTNFNFKRQLYPIVIGSHKTRKKSIYGIGEVAQAIPNNKAINFNLGMMLLSVQQTAWPKMVQKVGALARQQITNAPGEIITDYSKGNGWGVQYMNTSSFNAQALTLNNTIMDLTRTVSGSTEVVTGEVMGANMAASAIIALQNQAKKPIEMYQKKFQRTYEKIGKIEEQFFKYYYNDGRAFGYEEDGQVIVSSINGQQYKDIDFALSVDVGQAGTYSDSLSISLLDSLKADGTIDQDDYIELYPQTIMPFKEQLKKIRQKKKEQEAMMTLAGNGALPGTSQDTFDVPIQ